RRARLFAEQLNRDDEALETWQRVLDIDFSNVQALRAIAHVWRTREDPHELVGALHATIDRAAALLEPQELTEVYRELGKIYGTVEEQVFEASEGWRSLLDVGLKDFEAIDELEKFYCSVGRWTNVIAVKLQWAESLEEPAEKSREHVEMATLW